MTDLDKHYDLAYKVVLCGIRFAKKKRDICNLSDKDITVLDSWYSELKLNSKKEPSIKTIEEELALTKEKYIVYGKRKGFHMLLSSFIRDLEEMIKIAST